MKKLTTYKPLLILLLFLFTYNNIRAEDFCTCNPQADSLQLVTFYNETNGDDWTNSWDLDSPMSTWFGLVLTAEGCVEQLNMYVNFNSFTGNNLTGTLPDMILPDLRELVLQGNDVGGVLPDFSGMPALEIINFNLNNISGSLPNFTDNPALRSISMDGCPLSGSIPDFPNLPELSTLSFYFCGLEGTLPDFSACPNLSNIYLGQNNLTGTIPDFAQIPELRNLNLSQNSLTGDIFDFTNLPLLQNLNLNGNMLTGTIPDYQNMPLLRTLILADNEITGIIPDFSGLPLMQELQLGFNPLEGTIPDFSMMAQLKLLDISRANMIAQIPSFTNCPLLEKLSLLGNELTGAVPDFSGFPMITLRLQENNLSEMPDLSQLNDWGDFISNGIVVHENKFTFEDVLPNMPAANSGYWKYAPQDSIGQEETHLLVPGSDFQIDLGIDLNISDNIYTWYKNDVFYQEIIGDNTLSFFDLSLSDEGQYHCEVTNLGAPDLRLYSYKTTLTLCTQAEDALASNTGTYCTGAIIELNGSIDVSAATEVEYLWSGPDNYTSSAQSPTDATTAGTYIFTAILDGCPSLPATTEVQIFQTPSQPNISTDAPVICSGESLSLYTDAVPDVEYIWTGPQAFSSSSEDPLVSVAAQPNMSGEYSLILSNNGCLSPAATLDVSVMPLQDASFSYADICEEETATPVFIAVAGGVFSFANMPNDAANIDPVTGIISNTSAGSIYDVNYVLNEGGLCPASTTASFQVESTPTFQNITIDCAIDLQTYILSFSTEGQSVSADFGFVNNIGGNEWVVSDIPAGQDVQITASTASMLCNAVQEFSAPACECPIITPPMLDQALQEVCEDSENPTFTASVEAEYTANWYDETGQLVAENTLSYTPSMPGVYYVETYDPITDCVSDTRSQVELIIHTMPLLQVNNIECDTSTNSYAVSFYSNSNNISISEGELTALFDGNYLVQHVRDMFALEIMVQNATCTRTELVGVPDCYCGRIAAIEFAKPSCFGEADGVIFVEKGETYSSPVTIKVDGVLVHENVELPILLSGYKSGEYFIEITDQNACVKQEMLFISQPEKLILDLGQDAEIELGESLHMDIYTNISEIENWTWQSDTSALSCTNCFAPIAQPEQTTFYSLTLTDTAGCEVNDALWVFVKENIPVFAPDAFSPNNDGVNDYFTIYGDEEKVLQIVNMQIFDRWGNLIFSKNNFSPNDESAGWDGRHRGQEMKDEVYVFIAEVQFFTSQTTSLKGSIQLLR